MNNIFPKKIQNSELFPNPSFAIHPAMGVTPIVEATWSQDALKLADYNPWHSFNPNEQTFPVEKDADQQIYWGLEARQPLRWWSP